MLREDEKDKCYAKKKDAAKWKDYIIPWFFSSNI